MPATEAWLTLCKLRNCHLEFKAGKLRRPGRSFRISIPDLCAQQQGQKCTGEHQCLQCRAMGGQPRALLSNTHSHYFPCCFSASCSLPHLVAHSVFQSGPVGRRDLILDQGKRALQASRWWDAKVSVGAPRGGGWVSHFPVHAPLSDLQHWCSAWVLSVSIDWRGRLRHFFSYSVVSNYPFCFHWLLWILYKTSKWQSYRHLGACSCLHYFSCSPFKESKVHFSNF